MTGTTRSKLLPAILMLCALVTLVAVFGVIAHDQEHAEATFPGINGKIAFASVRNGDFDIYTMDPDGSNQKQLTQNLGVFPFSGVPAWSPDGQKIAFMTVDLALATGNIYLMNKDGSGLTNLTASFTGLPGSPAFSPDGSKMAFASIVGGIFQIHVMNIDGTGITNLSNNFKNDNQPDWSPDGSKIVFYRWGTASTSEIFVMNADGTNQTNLSNNALGIDQRPSWSPDGTSIAFNRNTGTSGDPTYDIFTMNPDGTGATNLTNTPGVWEIDPSWSPDGTKIAFHNVGTAEDDPNIYVMNADGSATIQLTDHPLQDVEPAWQPIPASGTVTPTPTSTPCSPGTCPKMALNVKGGDCDDALEPTTCAVVVGSTFMLSVDAIRIPPAGYHLMQTHIDYGPNLTHKEQPTLTEIVWPDMSAPSAASGPLGPQQVVHVAWTGFTPPILISTFVGNLVEIQMTCTPDPSTNDVGLLQWGDPAAEFFGSVFLDPDSNEVVPVVGVLTIDCVPPPTPTPTPTATPTMQPKPADTDGDGCPDAHESGPDETQGGQRDYLDPNDYYDVIGPNNSLVLDGVIDLPNDILGVILHFSPQGQPPYDVRYDRGESIGANHWERDVPDGVIDLPNDILGIILQHGHNCV